MTVAASIPMWLANWLDQKAMSTGKSVSAIIREALLAEYERRRQPELPFPEPEEVNHGE